MNDPKTEEENEIPPSPPGYNEEGEGTDEVQSFSNINRDGNDRAGDECGGY